MLFELIVYPGELYKAGRMGARDSESDGRTGQVWCTLCIIYYRVTFCIFYYRVTLCISFNNIMLIIISR